MKLIDRIRFRRLMKSGKKRMKIKGIWYSLGNGKK
jgi:hypothetical protein